MSVFLCVCVCVLMSGSPKVHARARNGALLCAVKVCQWVTLTPMQKRDEGGAGELGHMGRNESAFTPNTTVSTALQTRPVSLAKSLISEHSGSS